MGESEQEKKAEEEDEFGFIWRRRPTREETRHQEQEQNDSLIARSLQEETPDRDTNTEQDELTNILIAQLMQEEADQLKREREQQELADAAFALSLSGGTGQLKQEGREEQELAEQLKREREQQELADAAFALTLSEGTGQLKQGRDEEQERADAALALSLFEAEKKSHVLPVASVLSPEEVLGSLLPHQLRAVGAVRAKAKRMHEEALPYLQIRATALGITPKELKDCLEYIKDDAPIVIHLTETTLSKLAKDTHYRNLFETNTSGGTPSMLGRQEWEKAMFGDHYDGSSPFDRTKYGCLNITGDIQGVDQARRYGQCFLTLHQHVRYRATFFSQDTYRFGSRALATNEYYAHVLHEYTDADLKAATKIASTAGRIGGAPSKSSDYKEVQIHGPVCLAKDVQALSVPGREAQASSQLKRDVHAFQQKSGCTIFWQEDLLNPYD